MVKSDIVSALHERGYFKNQAGDVVDEVFQIISDALSRGEQVQVRGFGTFDVKVRKGRSIWDISVGGMRDTEDSITPVFRASESLKAAVRACRSPSDGK